MLFPALSADRIVYILIAVLFIIRFMIHSGSYHASSPPWESRITEQLQNAPEGLGYAAYKKMEDSLRQRYQQGNDAALGVPGPEFGMGTAMTTDGQRFFYVSGYKTGPEAKFYVEDSRSYMVHMVHEKKYADYSTFDWATDELPFRFIQKNSEGEGSVLYPVSRNTYHILRWVFGVLFIAVFLVGFYLIFGFPFKILSRISKGQAFSADNVDDLYTTAVILLAIGLIPLLLQYLMHFILLARLPGPVQFSYFGVFQEKSLLLILGMVVLLIARAFHKGMLLQKEQDLTV